MKGRGKAGELTMRENLRHEKEKDNKGKNIA